MKIIKFLITCILKTKKFLTSLEDILWESLKHRNKGNNK